MMGPEEIWSIENRLLQAHRQAAEACACAFGEGSQN